MSKAQGCGEEQELYFYPRGLSCREDPRTVSDRDNKTNIEGENNMIHPKHLLETVIRPTLEYLEHFAGIPHTEEAEQLLLMTAAHESLMGQYLTQINGPAKGIYQMEPATSNSIWSNYLHYRKDKKKAIQDLLHSVGDETSQLENNLMYATAMARLKYYPVSSSIPTRADYNSESDHLRALSQYAKDHYNTEHGRATPDDYFDDYLYFTREV